MGNIILIYLLNNKKLLPLIEAAFTSFKRLL